MKPDSSILALLKEAVAQQFGHIPLSPTDFDELALDVQMRTGRTISTSTLKRLWGYVRTEQGTTFSTLSLLCRYAGFNDWNQFCSRKQTEMADDDSDFGSDMIINCASLPIGETLMLRWSDCKMLVIRKREHPARFEVLRSENVKLKPSDQADITGLAIGMPFKATYCMRGNSIMGTYTGARHSGLDSIVPIKCE